LPFRFTPSPSEAANRLCAATLWTLWSLRRDPDWRSFKWITISLEGIQRVPLGQRLGQKKNGEMELHHRDSGDATQSVKAPNPARVIYAEHL
jgi:hypothetical protein